MRHVIFLFLELYTLSLSLYLSHRHILSSLLHTGSQHKGQASVCAEKELRCVCVCMGVVVAQGGGGG